MSFIPHTFVYVITLDRHVWANTVITLDRHVWANTFFVITLDRHIWANTIDSDQIKALYDGSEDILKYFLLFFFLQKIGFDIHANCLPRRQFAWNVKAYFLGKSEKIHCIVSLLSAKLGQWEVKLQKCHKVGLSNLDFQKVCYFTPRKQCLWGIYCFRILCPYVYLSVIFWFLNGAV